EGIAELKDRLGRARATGNRDYNPGWHTWLDLHSLLTAAEAVTRAALERRESRGGHTRDDYPDSDAGEAESVVLVRRDGGRMTAVREPAPVPPPELRKIIDEGVPGV